MHLHFCLHDGTHAMFMQLQQTARSHTCGASTMMVNMECERLDAWLSAVRAFCRARLPRRSTSTASSAQFTGTCGGYDWNQQMAQRLPACSCNGIFA